jgi:cation diffusion facilitator family transporter
MDRNTTIIRASWWAIAGNTFLAALKLSIGFVSDSYAVLADGIDSATDTGSFVVVLVAARYMAKPPNIRFPYGYNKADTIATRILSLIIFFAGAQLAYSSVTTLIEGTTTRVPSPIAIYVTVISIVCKLVLALFLFRTGKKAESQMLATGAKNMRNDIFISLSVLVSLFCTVIFEAPVIDRIIASVISGFIMFSAYRIFMKSNIDLMDGIDDPQLYLELFAAVNKVEGAHNPHRVRARKIGNQYIVNLDIEVDPVLSVHDAHIIAGNVERSIRSSLKNIYDIRVHVEPLGNLETGERYGISEKEIEKRKTLNDDP